MPSTLPIITFRLSKEENAKFKYIATENCRKFNDELKMLVLKHIKNYESEHGKIIIADTEEDNTEGNQDTKQINNVKNIGIVNSQTFNS